MRLPSSAQAGAELLMSFSATTTSRVVTVEGVAEGRTALTARESAHNLPEGSTVAPAELSVTVVPAPVRLQLVFDPSTLTVTAGSAATATLRLSGVPAGAAVTVALRFGGYGDSARDAVDGDVYRGYAEP